MTTQRATDHADRSQDLPIGGGVRLFVVGGVALIGAGALIWFAQGAMVVVTDPIFAFLARCF